MGFLYDFFTLAQPAIGQPSTQVGQTVAPTLPAAASSGSSTVTSGTGGAAPGIMEQGANAAKNVVDTTVHTAPQREQPLWMTLVFVGVMILVFWLLLIRPQQKQRKKQEEFITALKAGDKVVTAAGLIGRIVNISGDVATLELAQDVRVKIVKSQIVSQYSEATEEKKPD